MIRCKFVVTSARVTGEAAGGTPVLVLHALPVVAGSEENKAYWGATPAGHLTLTVTNSAAFEEFRDGDEFYLDMTKTES